MLFLRKKIGWIDMGIFSRLFKRKTEEVINKTEKIIITNKECLEILEIKTHLNQLLAENRFLAKSDFREYLGSVLKTIEYFEVLQKSSMLERFCENNHVSVYDVRNIIDEYYEFETIIDKHNEEYIQATMINEKEYLDNILAEVDSNILLDDDQRRVILTEEDHCLVIAGAGAGKTTTVAAKVKYLVEKKKVDPKEILVISFTNKAVQELKDKINNQLKIDCPIATFHSTGNAILRKQSSEKLNIVSQAKLYFVLQDYFKSAILKNESLVNNLILFFGSYFDAPYEGKDLNIFFNQIAKANYSTMKSDLDGFKKKIVDVRSKKTVTIQNEVLRSYQEVEIANFLYLNKIDYEYEPLYKYDILFARKPYTPDFIIRQGDKEAYIEHFGITQSGENDRYNEEELSAYKKAINDKVRLHKKHGTNLIYTFSRYNDGKSLLIHLQNELEKNGFSLSPRSNKEIIEKLVLSEESRYIKRLVLLVCRFIYNYKTNGYGAEEFARMYHSTVNERSKLFLNICNDCYLQYEKYLKENNAVDFEDMINESARILCEVKEMEQKLDFKYIIVDEYQDISRQRFDLVTALSDVTDAKIIAVGDDWQSIYAFSGSDITLFTKFEEKMGYASLLKITNTYRNSQEVIDIAGNFIQKNSSQIKKSLKSPKHIDDPVVIYTYDGRRKRAGESNKSGANYAMACAVQTAIEDIISHNKKENKPYNSSILLLGRFGFDGNQLEKSGLFEFIKRGSKIKSVKHPGLNITFMTAHSSKGLGYDNVIIINGRNETYGFPSKIEDDPVLSFVVKEDRSIDYAEERRLFYVAMTRTKNRVYFVAPEENPSEFLLELKKDYKSIKLCGEWNEDTSRITTFTKKCPICGYPLQLKYKNAYGLRLYICTNEPEVCGFMTNEFKAGKLSIQKCDQCRDGYLIVKPKKNGEYFLGCTNYKKDGTGCERIIWKSDFYKQHNLDPDAVENEALETLRKKEIVSKKSNQPVQQDENTIEKANIIPIEYEGMNLNEVVYIILMSVMHIGRKHYYGVTVLTDLLKGKQTQKILKAELNDIPEYGKLQFMDRGDIICIIDWLIKNKYLLKTNHPRYPVLHPTYEGIHYKESMTAGKMDDLRKELNKKYDGNILEDECH